MRRTKTQENVVEPEPITVEEAINYDLGEGIYSKVSDLVKKYGSDLILRIYQEKSDHYTSGYLGEVEGSEVNSFIQSPENFLKENYGGGIFKVSVVNGLNKRFLAHLKIPIALSKNSNPNPPMSYDDITKARKEGRQEILELATLIKPAASQTQPPAIDLVAIFKVVSEAQDKIRVQENALREKELILLKETLAKTSLSGEMKEISELFKSALAMVNQSMKFSQNLNPLVEPSPDAPWWERILVQLGERILTTKPELFDKVSSMPSQVNIPKEPSVPLTSNLLPPIPREEQTSKEETSAPDPSKTNQINFETAFQFMLLNQLERATMDIEPDFCAECLLTDLEVLSKKGLITLPQIDQAHKLLISDQLETYIKNFFPDIAKYKAWLINFQSAIKEGASEPPEGASEPMKQ